MPFGSAGEVHCQENGCGSDGVTTSVCVPVPGYAMYMCIPLHVCVYARVHEEKRSSYFRFTAYYAGSKGGVWVLVNYYGNEHP